MRDERLSVMMFTHSTVRAGAEEYMLMLASGLDRRYFRAHLACPPELAERYRPDIPSHVELIEMDLTSLKQWLTMLRFGKDLRQRQIDILHSHMFFSSLLATPVGWCSRTPIIIEGAHGREAWRKGWKDHYFVDRCIGRMVDFYVAVSAANAQYLTTVKGFSSDKITVIHPGSDLRSFDPDRQAPPGLREALGFGHADPVILVMGRLEPQKGHHILLDAMPAVRRQFPNVRLVCAGEGALRGELEAQARSLGLDDMVRFIGYRSDIRDWLALATFTVLPSYWEGLPIAPIESLAAQRTVVATAVDGTPDVVVDGKTGLTVPPGDPVALAEAICRVMSNEDLRLNLARRGRQWVIENFSAENMVSKTERLYWKAWQRCARKTQNARRILMPSEAMK